MTKHILVIDDEADIRDVIQMSLEGFGGWQVMKAESGCKGLLTAKAEPFDAILLDISMPEMDGFECFEQLQADLKTQMIPVVLLTAKALASDRRRYQPKIIRNEAENEKALVMVEELMHRGDRTPEEDEPGRARGHRPYALDGAGTGAPPLRIGWGGHGGIAPTSDR
ncbi:MAG: response regulator [Microcoleus sp.]